MSAPKTYRFPGTVYYFDDVRGFGFARTNHSDSHVMIHHTVIDMFGHRMLCQGQKIFMDFVVHETDGKPAYRATRVDPEWMDPVEAYDYIAETMKREAKGQPEAETAEP